MRAKLKKLYEQQTKILEKLDEHRKILEDHKREISNLHDNLQGVRQELEDNKRELSSLQNEVQGVQQTLEVHTQRLGNMQKSIDNLKTQVGTYTLRSGHMVERTMIELYKEALYGVDPDKVKYVEIIDEKGVIDQKGNKYEVDFYEVADGEV